MQAYRPARCSRFSIRKRSDRVRDRPRPMACQSSSCSKAQHVVPLNIPSRVGRRYPALRRPRRLARRHSGHYHAISLGTADFDSLWRQSLIRHLPCTSRAGRRRPPAGSPWPSLLSGRLPLSTRTPSLTKASTVGMPRVRCGRRRADSPSGLARTCSCGTRCARRALPRRTGSQASCRGRPGHRPRTSAPLDH